MAGLFPPDTTRRHLILPLAGPTDAHAALDADALARANRTARLHAHSTAQGWHVHVLASGAALSSTPPSTPHWQLVAGALRRLGVPAEAIVTPHTR